jgi:hypothetical protein
MTFARVATTSVLVRTLLLGTAQACVVVYVVHRRHGDMPAGHPAGHHAHGADLPVGGTAGLDPTVHYLRDASLAVPGFVIAALVATLVAYRLCRGLGDEGEGVAPRLVLAVATGVSAAVATVAGAAVHAWLFEDPPGGLSALAQGADAIVALRFAFAVAVVFALVAGVPWSRSARDSAAERAHIRSELQARLRAEASV